MAAAVVFVQTQVVPPAAELVAEPVAAVEQ